MTTLSQLKLVDAQRPTSADPIVARRGKLLRGIEEQAELINAMMEGKEYTPTKTKTVVDKETGETRLVQKPKQVRSWFWRCDEGKLYLSIRYGNRVLELAKGKTAIEAKDDKDLLKILGSLKNAALAGELDSAINEASARTKANFTKA